WSMNGWSARLDPWSHARYRSSGSRAFHRSTSSLDRYRVASSAVECGPIRYVTASIRVGTPSSRARAAASRVAWYTASTSLPSTCTPGKPYASAFRQIGATVCADTGTEIAHWLFWQKKITGAWKTAAKLQPSWKSPSEVAPSPKYASVQSEAPSSFAPIA